MGCSFVVIGTKRQPLSTDSLCGCPLNYTSTSFKSALISYIKGICFTQSELIKPVIPKANGGNMRVASNEGGGDMGEGREERTDFIFPYSYYSSKNPISKLANSHTENFLKVTFIYTSGLILYWIKFSTIEHCNLFVMLILDNFSPHNYLFRDTRAESK